MRISEFSKIPDLEDVDLLDDLQFFMENDPAFYRRILFPIISELRDKIKSGKHCNESEFRSCIDKAAHLYCKKFNIPDNPKSVFTDVDRDALANKIFGQEKDRIEKGEYDGSSE